MKKSKIISMILILLVILLLREETIFADKLSLSLDNNSSLENITFDKKFNIPIDKVWKIRFNREFSKDEVEEINIESKNEVVDINKIYSGREIHLETRSDYEYDTEYKIDISLANGNVYKMFFDTISQRERKIYKTTDNYKDEYIRMEAIKDGKIEVSGMVDPEKTNWMLKLESDSKEIEDIKIWRTVNSDGSYGGVINLGTGLEDGSYKLSIYIKDKDDSYYKSYYWNIPIIYRDGEFSFKLSPVFKENHARFMQSQLLDPNNYLSLKNLKESEADEIIDLAEKITINESSDYNKILMISDWVSKNIYYDWDAYTSGKIGRTDAYGTLIERKSVCQGYAELTNALLRSIEIPSRIVVGYALTSDLEWDSVNDSVSNHAWNEVYVDGRWMILDTTWNSRNRYINGEFISEDMYHKYFDPNLETFSYTHKIHK